MTSKKTVASKRDRLPRGSDYIKSFIKDWGWLSHSGRYVMKRLKEVMLLLIATEAPVDSEWPDHPLGGNWEGHRECHVGGDFLLAYKLNSSSKI